jgi:3-hydroxymyristoyl/3-hydroxydecanoyl-(acyl carrier protein) dehydratase
MIIDKKIPEISKLVITENRAEFVAHLTEDLLYFQGHFPNTAILPGVAQVHWAVLWGRELLGIDGAFAGMAKPGDDLNILLEWSSEKSRLNFKYSLTGQVVSSGRVRLR